MKNRNLEHVDHWKTPDWLYDALDVLFAFDFDPCPLLHDFKIGWDGLTISWGRNNFVNPPYNLKDKTAFILKAVEEQKLGKTSVLLLPVSTSTKLFHNTILPNASKIQFIEGRVKFVDMYGNSTKGGQHDSMLVLFDGASTSKDALAVGGNGTIVLL